MGLIFAGLGYSGSERPSLALAVSALVPLGLWPVVRRLEQSKKKCSVRPPCRTFPLHGSGRPAKTPAATEKLTLL